MRLRRQRHGRSIGQGKGRQVDIWSYPPADFDRNGIVSLTDLLTFIGDQGSSGSATTRPTTDTDLDGDTDGDDWAVVLAQNNSQVAQLRVSGVGTMKTSPAQLRRFLKQENLWGLLYGGHGSGSVSLVPQVPESTYGSVSENDYRAAAGRHHLGQLSLWACFSGDTLLTRRTTGINTVTWSDNVSETGVLSLYLTPAAKSGIC